ncbi:HEPN domain-containing protein [Candidatus Kuenenbacteria bacterium]|nr:HEPN domain-containing protein [Candidatus Kuenenbacteria bacterium]
MELTKKQIQEIVDYWKQGAEHDWETAQSLWNSKRYDACLFFCHLVLEKLLKGLVVKRTEIMAPHIHDLAILLQKANIITNETQIKKLAAFTNFNIKGRYSDVKFIFYKLCTREFTKQHFEEAKKIILWLKKLYQNNK